MKKEVREEKMENVIREVVVEGKRLSEKRTWVSKGYNDLLDKVNRKLSDIPNMDENELSYLLREFTYKKDGETYTKEVRCNLVFEKGDVFLELILEKETECGNWESEKLPDPSTETIRVFTNKLPEMFDYFLEEIKKSNGEYQEAIDKITELLGKITS